VQFSKEVLFQAGNAVILIDPDDSNSIADAMKSMLDESISKKIKNGYKRLKQILLIRKNSEKILITKLLQFEKKLQ
jgi:ATP-dependent Zn protease